MAGRELKRILVEALREAGLVKCPGCYLNLRFVLAMLAGMLVLWLMHERLPVFSAQHEFDGALLVSIIVWQPLIEELLFRGIVQGQLLNYQWARHSVCKITTANMITSALFVGLHMLSTPSLWSLAIFIPSLLFGYFRDAFGSVYPAMCLHSAYNFMVIAGLLISGNLLINSAAI